VYQPYDLYPFSEPTTTQIEIVIRTASNILVVHDFSYILPPSYSSAGLADGAAKVNNKFEITKKNEKNFSTHIWVCRKDQDIERCNLLYFYHLQRS
jgi:hypothetical protein